MDWQDGVVYAQGILRDDKICYMDISIGWGNDCSYEVIEDLPITTPVYASKEEAEREGK